MKLELERRAARLAAARRKLAELTVLPVEPELLAEIERVHAKIEVLERRLQKATMPALAVRTRQRLAAAQAAERALLTAHGFDSWLGLQLRRVEHLLHQPPAEELEAAEVEHRRALASWQELAENTEAAARGQVAAARPAQAITAAPTIGSVLPTLC
ncbi:MAG TPA: hypothetical protein VGL92_10120 [Acidimicrobiia bacterium]|jgi:hypothetical protein